MNDEERKANGGKCKVKRNNRLKEDKRQPRKRRKRSNAPKIIKVYCTNTEGKSIRRR